MNTTSIATLDYGDRLASIANAYKRLGFNVTVSPSIDDLPDFLSAFQPDLIARNSSQSLIVELKNRVHVKPFSYWLKLETAIKEHPEWKLQLVDPGSLDIDLAPGSEPADSKTISKRIHQADQLLASRNSELAIVVAFGALEAAMRAVNSSEQLSWDRANVLTLMSTLLESGYLDLDDANLLRKLMEKRNSIVHGFSGPPVEVQDVQKIIDLARELTSYL